MEATEKTRAVIAKREGNVGALRAPLWIEEAYMMLTRPTILDDTCGTHNISSRKIHDLEKMKMTANRAYARITRTSALTSE